MTVHSVLCDPVARIICNIKTVFLIGERDDLNGIKIISFNIQLAYNV